MAGRLGPVSRTMVPPLSEIWVSSACHGDGHGRPAAVAAMSRRHCAPGKLMVTTPS